MGVGCSSTKYCIASIIIVNQTEICKKFIWSSYTLQCKKTEKKSLRARLVNLDERKM